VVYIGVMTEEQKAWWCLNLWFGLPGAIELILLIGLIAVLTIPKESFPKKVKTIVIAASALVAIPTAIYLSTIVFATQLQTFQNGAFAPPQGQ
jgi:hypothetical protein